MKKYSFPALTAFLVVLFPAPEAAAQWYAGVEAGMMFDTFRAAYAFQVGTPDRYDNRASGPEVGILLGRDFALNKTLTLGVEIRGAVNRARWELDTDDVYEGTAKGGPARLRYEIPWNIRATAVLKVKVLPDLALTGEWGIGLGSIREKKTSVTSTSYAYEAWSPGFAAGAGLEWRLSPKIDLIARFAYIGYREFTYTSRFPDGELWETITDRPFCLSGRLGLLFRVGGR